MPPSTAPFVPPPDLVDSVRDGRCVAFVGAGFSQPTIPGWQGLLRELAEQIEPRKRDPIRVWLETPNLTRRDYEGLGEAIELALGSSFRSLLKQTLSKPVLPETKERLRLLQAIPFHYVLTTNFDDVLGRGATPRPETFARALGADTRPWWHREFWDPPFSELPCWHERIIALHGQASSLEGPLVFTTQSYRRLLHEQPSYRSFLRTLFATRNMLFLGFSFTDAYVDELRSEILSMIGLDRSARKLVDYAILEDVPDSLARHMLESDGLHPLTFCTDEDGLSKRNFSGFRNWLQAIHDATAPRESLRARLAGKRLLWCDPARDGNALGTAILRADGKGLSVTEVATVDEALREVTCRRDTSPFDLVIIRWGHKANGGADALDLLGRMGTGPRPPTLVFASGHHRAENRRRALEHGALAYTDTWSELFRVLDRLLTDGDRSDTR